MGSFEWVGVSTGICQMPVLPQFWSFLLVWWSRFPMCVNIAYLLYFIVTKMQLYLPCESNTLRSKWATFFDCHHYPGWSSWKFSILLASAFSYTRSELFSFKRAADFRVRLFPSLVPRYWSSTSLRSTCVGSRLAPECSPPAKMPVRSSFGVSNRSLFTKVPDQFL